MKFRPWVSSLVLIILLVGCGASETTSPTVGPTTAATGTAATTTVPTTSSPPTSMPTALATGVPEATTPPGANRLLPAPLYYNMGGQIYRLEVDGKTTTKITDEQPFQSDALAITEFDVLPTDGSLVYLVQNVDANNRTVQTLVRTDAEGKNRTVLVEGSSAAAPRWSPDGSQIAFGVIVSPGDPPQELEGGVYVIPASGGEPQLVQASDIVDNPSEAAPNARSYIPTEWSPDGRKLLLRAFLPMSEFCETALKDLQSDELIKPTPPEGSVTGCGVEAWSPDSATLYLPTYQPGFPTIFAGLWRFEAGTGELTQVISNTLDGKHVSIEGVQPTEGGELLAFAAISDEPFYQEPEMTPPNYTMHMIGVDGSLKPLRSDNHPLTGWPQWAPDRSGAAIMTATQSPQQTVLWLPVDGGAAVELLTGELSSTVQWGP